MSKPFSRPCPSRRAVLTGATAMIVAGRARPARAEAAPVDVPAPGPQDTCPVCGMFVAPYKEWVATVLYEDGRALHFDGPKDMFKFLAEPDRYLPGYADTAVKAVGVTEYYGLKRVDGRAALYVSGSDVLGPMGHELVPLASAADAADYLKDHAGKRQMSFAGVTPEILHGLDEGHFE